MSTRTRYHSRDRHPWPEPSASAEDADRARPQYIARGIWERMSPEQRAAVRVGARPGAAGTSPSPGTGARTLERAQDGAERYPDDAGLSGADLAILRPLGKLSTVHDMAERLGLPTPARPRPATTTAEEARR